MRMEQFHYFVEIARCQSIKKAAGHLYITQQSLSQSIKNLEKELECALLLRSSGGICLTEEGRLFLTYAERVIKEQELFRESLNKIRLQKKQQELTGSLTIHAFGVYDYSILPRLLRVFRQQYPKVSIKTCPADFVTLEHTFIENYDRNSVGLIVLPDVRSSDMDNYFSENHMKFFPIGHSQYLLCCGKDHPLTKGHSASLEALKKYPMIYLGANGFPSGSIYGIMKHYGYMDIPLQLETLSINIWLDTIAEGETIGFLHEFIYDALLRTRRTDMEGIATVPLQQKFGNIIGYVVKEKHSATVDCFTALLKAERNTQSDSLSDIL